MSIISIILIVGYFIYRQTDYVACIAGVQAAFLVDGFADPALYAAKQNARNLTEKYKMEAK